MTLPVFIDLDADASAEYLTLDGPEGRHAATVMRARPGELIEVVNGRGVRIRAEVEEVTPTGLSLRAVTTVQDPQSVPHVTIIQALAKAGRDEMAVEICTELGADAFIPWQADRSIVRWNSQKALKGEKKWRDQAIAAAKQSRRSYVPEVKSVMKSTELARAIDGYSQVLICHETATQAIEDVDFGMDIAVVVGPEGGISDAELALFEEAGATAVSLGPHVLRASTAGAVALAAISIVSGRHR